jgi:uncharacterized membrane protein (DUF4010 family)
VLVLVHLAQDAFDSAAIYGLAGLAAIPGADAPSLSLARLAADGRLDLSTAATGVIVVAVATTLAKLGILLVVGRRVALRTAASLLGIAAVGAAFLYVLAR